MLCLGVEEAEDDVVVVVVGAFDVGSINLGSIFVRREGAIFVLCYVRFLRMWLDYF